MYIEPAVAAIFFSLCGINFIMVPLLMLNALQYRKALKAFRSVATPEQRIQVADLLNKAEDES